MKQFIRIIAAFILKIFYPHLYYIEKNKAQVGRLGKNISNSRISKYAQISVPAQIGSSDVDDYSYVASNSCISLTKIGKFCSIGPNLMCGYGIHPINGISTSPAFYSTKNQAGIVFSETDKIEENKSIEIGNDVFIGMNVVILDGIKIGDGAIIGAGAVVSKNIPPYAIAVGSPIKITRYRFNEDQIAALLKIRWWDFSFEKLKDVERNFFDVQKFIDLYSK